MCGSFQFFKLNAIDAAKKGNRHLSRVIRAKSNLNMIDNDGRTPLMWACIYQRTDCVRALIQAKVDLDIKDKDGKTALMWACRMNLTEYVSALVTAGADVNTRDKNGDTILTWLCGDHNNTEIRRKDRNGNVTICPAFGCHPSVNCIRALMPRADLNMTNKDGYTPLMLAVSNHYWKYADVLKAEYCLRDNKRFHAHTLCARVDWINPWAR
jgi:ankyrin repeat protein